MTKWVPYAVAIVVAMLVLQGCMLDRLRQAHRDLCDHAVRLEYPGDIVLVFDRPVLLDSDIIKIAGLRPKSTFNEAADRLTFEYVATRTPAEESGRHSLPVFLDFEGEDGKFKLKRARPSSHLKDILSAELLQEVLASGCAARLRGTVLVFDLAALTLKRLPGRETVEQILGAPSKRNGRTLAYEYVLNSSENVLIEIAYDEELDRMLAARVQYFRYVFEVDFSKLQATAKLKDWHNALALSYWVTVSQ
jgi:hypothetical protein